MLDTDLLRTFVAVVDTGGFTAAARTVHRTQSAVSMQIRRLEATVGRRLFRRGGRSVALTPAGETLLGYSRRILHLQDEALWALREPGLFGVVRLGIPDDYVMCFVPSLLGRFAETYPRVQVEVRCEDSRALVSALHGGELDLALVTCDPGEESGEILRQEPTVWAASERHRVHESDPVPLALFQPGCWFRDWALRTLDHAGRRYRIAYTSPSVGAIQAALAAGLAVGVLGRGTLPPGVRVLRADEGFPPLPAATIALHRGTGHESAVDFLAEHMRRVFGQADAGAGLLGA